MTDCTRSANEEEELYRTESNDKKGGNLHGVRGDGPKPKRVTRPRPQEVEDIKKTESSHNGMFAPNSLLLLLLVVPGEGKEMPTEGGRKEGMNANREDALLPSNPVCPLPLVGPPDPSVAPSVVAVPSPAGAREERKEGRRGLDGPRREASTAGAGAGLGGL